LSDSVNYKSIGRNSKLGKISSNTFSIFSKKEPMLKYIRRSLELGKTKAEFLDDNDFTQYKH